MRVGCVVVEGEGEGEDVREEVVEVPFVELAKEEGNG